MYNCRSICSLYNKFYTRLLWYDIQYTHKNSYKIKLLLNNYARHTPFVFQIFMEKKKQTLKYNLYMYRKVYRCTPYIIVAECHVRGRRLLSGQRSNFKNIRRLISLRRATNIVVLHKMGVKYIVYSQHTHTDATSFSAWPHTIHMGLRSM